MSSTQIQDMAGVQHWPWHGALSWSPASDRLFGTPNEPGCSACIVEVSAGVCHEIPVAIQPLPNLDPSWQWCPDGAFIIVKGALLTVPQFTQPAADLDVVLPDGTIVFSWSNMGMSPPQAARWTHSGRMACLASCSHMTPGSPISTVVS